MEDQDRNESNITRPRTYMKNGVCVRIWIGFSLVIPSMDSIDPIFLFYILYFFSFL